jgi:hypothetical protein
MGFLSRKDHQADNGMRASALVVEADAPPQGAPPFGSGSHGMVRILVDNGSGAASISGKFKYKEDYGSWSAGPFRGRLGGGPEHEGPRGRQ